MRRGKTKESDGQRKYHSSTDGSTTMLLVVRRTVYLTQYEELGGPQPGSGRQRRILVPGHSCNWESAGSVKKPSRNQSGVTA